ncbi:hypothetical protein SEPCBS57363_000293 [Sporothrix epigloea]|uniref:Uncharacterized protein n=1 Tax=Sporothrix epigloea TaxID=1892477 RepID=A0ABP0D3Y3_9PEZI
MPSIDNFTLPPLDTKEDFVKWWMALKKCLRYNEEIGYLNPEDPKYAGWTEEKARTNYYGEAPKDDFPNIRPPAATARPTIIKREPGTSFSPSDDENTDLLAAQQTVSPALSDLWAYKTSILNSSNERYRANVEHFNGLLDAANTAIDSSVTILFKIYFAASDGPQEKIKKVLQHARPHPGELDAKLTLQNMAVMDAAPTSINFNEDLDFDAWLSNWEKMICKQFDLGGAEVSGHKWLYNLAAKFSLLIPRLCYKILDLSESLTGDLWEDGKLVFSVRTLIRHCRCDEYLLHGGIRRTIRNGVAIDEPVEKSDDESDAARKRVRLSSDTPQNSISTGIKAPRRRKRPKHKN